MCGRSREFLASGAHKIGPAVSYSIGQGATMVSACWGVFVWHEFAGAPRQAKRLLVLMFIFFLIGLGVVACSALFGLEIRLTQIGLPPKRIRNCGFV